MLAFLCFCGGVVVFFVVAFLWCFCGGVFVVVYVLCSTE